MSAALAFQFANEDHNKGVTDDIRPEIRIGISLGEVVIADGTITGAGVVLAQRLEQLAEPGGRMHSRRGLRDRTAAVAVQVAPENEKAR